MTNSVNVEFIVEKLLSFLATATDDHFRTDLVGRITQCAERFAPSNAWFVNTVVRVFELAGDKVKMSVAQTLMQLIAEGSEVEEDDDGTAPVSFPFLSPFSHLSSPSFYSPHGLSLSLVPVSLSAETGERKSFDDELRSHAVEDFLSLLQKPAMPDVLAQAMAWVLGEYGYLSHSQTPELIMVNLLDLCKQTSDPCTRSVPLLCPLCSF
jgi:AP-4 complex subunit epsilon-1